MVSVKDAIVILKSVVNEFTITNGDLNGDGRCNLADVLRLLKHIVK